MMMESIVNYIGLKSSQWSIWIEVLVIIWGAGKI